MKFLCPNCKAKYQIDDEKLKGRGVRMKCRKCGHIIKIPARVHAKKQAAAKPKPSVAPKKAETRKSPLPPRPSAPGAPRPPRPSSPGKPPARPSPKPASPSAAAPPPPAGKKDRPSEPESGGLHKAFVNKVASEPPPPEPSVQVLSAGATEEWYVGINGVPVGPVRLSTLRQKAMMGAVDEESLVWREGFEEWLPLKTFPELVALVKEAKEAGARPSFVPSAHKSSQPAPAGQAKMPAPQIPGPAQRPAEAAVDEEEEGDEDEATIIAPGGAAAMLAQASSSPVATPSGGTQLQAQVTGDPFAASPPPTAAGAPEAALGPSAVVDVAKAGSSEPPSAEASERHSFVDELALGVRRQARMHPLAYVLIAVALGFGVTAAVVFFGDSGSAPAPVTTKVVIVEKKVPTPVSPGAGQESDDESSNEEKNGTKAKGHGRRLAKASGAGAGAKKGDKKKESDIPMRKVGLDDGPSLTGPSLDTTGASAGSNLPSELSQSEIARVVASHRALVKRRCWEPAMAARSKSASKSAKVVVSLQIAPSGRVSSASVSGGAGYPGLASCIQRSVKRWTFPRAAGTSRVTIPFHFVSQ